MKTMINHPNRRRASKISTTNNLDHDLNYSGLLEGVRRSFDNAVKSGAPVFITDAQGLNDLYLDTLPSERQHHNCHSCRRFVETYGALATVNDKGDLVPIMWADDGVPDFYAPSFQALADRVRKARIVSVFLSKQKVWGTPTTGAWSHMAVTPPVAMVFRERLLTDSQTMAAAKENYRTVATALTEFTPPMLDEAIRLLSADSLARSEKFIGPAKWLRALHDRPKGRKGENLMWRAIAVAPEGYCHPKASVVGPLLDDIAAGLPFADIKAKFDAKMHPLAYQRPQAAPTAGNIKAAEAIVEKMGIGPSLQRRFARLDDLDAIWFPDEEKPKQESGGVFSHLKPKASPSAVRPVNIPASVMTWDKFTRTVLPNATAMEMSVPMSGSFIAMTAAENEEAPPILKWDREDERNTIAWYVYPGGSSARQWGLIGGSWVKVNAVSALPTMWGSKPMPFLGEGVVLVLDGAVDSNDNAGNALFPETIKDDFHSIRATVEAYSRAAKLSGRAEASACGYDLRKSGAKAYLRVFVDGAWMGYHIDRWD